MKQYDIFISYRRSSYDTANLIATRLKAAGYSVFFDIEALRAGKFNEQLYEVIDNCKDFISVLPPDALDRCVNDDDWVRLEICRAMERDKNIVPVMLNGFTWPDPMPEGMEELCNYQALTANSIEYFEMSMERLQKMYLTSKPQLPVHRLMKFAGVIVLALLAVVAVLWGVFMLLSRDVCQKYATQMTKDASAIHLLADENERLVKDWELFDREIARETRPERMEALQSDMLARIDVTEKNIRMGWTVDSVEMSVSDYHSFLLSLNGINAEEIRISPTFATLYYTDYLDQLNSVRRAVTEPNTINRGLATTLFKVFTHSSNGYYAALLAEFSNFPEDALKTFHEMRPAWIHFPTTYSLDEKKEYYENIQQAEMKKAEELLADYRSQLTEQDAKLEDTMHQLDVMEQEMEEGFNNMANRMDSTAAVLEAVAEINRIKQENEQNLAMRREKVNAKKVHVEAMKAELAELDKQYVEAYEAMKRKCTIEESDDQWYQWGKIRRWGSFLVTIVDSRKELEAKGIRSTSSITPDIAYVDMNSQLTVYQSYHPEAKDYVASAKQFYRELSKGKRPYSGVIIFGFKDNAVHPVLKAGDIIIGYDGKAVKNYDELKAAFKQKENAQATFLRLVNGEFVEMEYQWEETGIVGFLELTE